MRISCKILDYRLALRKRECKIDIKKDEWIKTVSFNKFAENSLNELPAVARKAIKQDIKWANIFDKFLCKLFEWEDEETL
jgi:uncharacterized protein YajQ (UPF0234 family)